MRITIELPDDLCCSLTARAAVDGSSVKELLVRLVQLGLGEADRTKAVASTLPLLVAEPLALSLDQMSRNAALYAVIDAHNDGQSIALITGASPPSTRNTHRGFA